MQYLLKNAPHPEREDLLLDILTLKLGGFIIMYNQHHHENKYWMLQVLQLFRSVQCADNDASTQSDDDPTPIKFYKALDTGRCMQLL